MSPPEKPSVVAQILAPLAGFFLFLFGLTLLCPMMPMRGGQDYPGLEALLHMLMLPLPFTLGALAYLTVHRAFDHTTAKDEPSPYRIATSPAHFLWCVLEPVVTSSLLLAHFPGYNSGVVPPLDAVMAFGTGVAPWLLFLTALGLIRKHPMQAILGLLTALAVPVAALAFH